MTKEHVDAGAIQYGYDTSLRKLKDFASETEFGSTRYIAMSDFINATYARIKVRQLKNEIVADGRQNKDQLFIKASDLRIAEYTVANFITRAK